VSVLLVNNVLIGNSSPHSRNICRWPSARPDSIVTEAEYIRVAKSVRPADVSKMLTSRVPWERGIHQNYTGTFLYSWCSRRIIKHFLADTYGDQPLFANTDMAQRWNQLGFIVPRPSGGPDPIFVETQRNLHRERSLSPSPKTGRPRGGGIPLPTPDSPEQPIQTVESLREHLQAAMAVELSTIPLYLFGMYTVKIPKPYVNDPRYYDPIIGAVRGTFDSRYI
jgi:hypothetical protein